VLPDTSAVATGSSREAYRIYEDLEEEKRQGVVAISEGYSNFNKKSPMKSASPAKQSQLRSQETLPIQAEEGQDEDMEEDEYEVNGILGHEIRKENGKKQVYYLVDWVGDWDPTWEPAENIGQGAIEEYNLIRKNSRRMAHDDGTDSFSTYEASKGNSRTRKDTDKEVVDNGTANDGFESDPDSLFVNDRRPSADSARQGSKAGKPSRQDIFDDSDDMEGMQWQGVEGSGGR